MPKVQTIKSYKTTDGKLFTSLDDANYHADKLNAEYLLRNDNDFQTNLYTAIHYIVFQTYTEVTFNHAKNIVPINLYRIENMIGHEIVDYTKLTAFGGLINDKLKELNLQLVTTKGPQDENATRGVHVTYRNDDNNNEPSFNVNLLENHIGQFMFPYYDAFNA